MSMVHALPMVVAGRVGANAWFSLVPGSLGTRLSVAGCVSAEARLSLVPGSLGTRLSVTVPKHGLASFPGAWERG